MEPFPEIDTQPGHLRAWENDGLVLYPLIPEDPSDSSYHAFLDTWCRKSPEMASAIVESLLCK